MVSRRAFFLETPAGQRFAISVIPAGAPKGAILYIHPFAEEMNKSRRMAALAANALAEQGWLVLQLDLAGCGDSSGDFGDANWQMWQDDVTHGWQWLNQQCNRPIVIWTLRAGSLVVSDWLQNNEVHAPLFLWQPIINGQQHLTQFLRLKAISEMLGDSGSKNVVAKLLTDLESNKSVEVAGYTISPQLASGLLAARLELPHSYPAPVNIFELVPQNRIEPSPGISRFVQKCEDDSIETSVNLTNGPSFWQTQEIETAPSLIHSFLNSVNALAL